MGLLSNISEETKNKVIELHESFKIMTNYFTNEYSNSFPYIFNASERLYTNSNHPNKEFLKKETNFLIQGMLTVYFFAIWDELMPNWNEFDNRKLDDYLKDDEKLQLAAYRHIRHTAAHKIKGERANNSKSKFEQYYEANPNFSGIVWDENTDSINLVNSTIGADVANFMKNMSIKLSFRVLDEINEEKSIF